MTPDPTPDPAAVKIAEDTLFDEFTDTEQEAARAVVAALTREYEFCPHGTLAELERLRAELAKVKGYQLELAERCYRKDLELDELRERAAR